MVLFASALRDGEQHINPHDLLTVLAGQGRRHAFARGDNRSSTANTPLCNLFVSMLDRCGRAGWAAFADGAPARLDGL